MSKFAKMWQTLKSVAKVANVWQIDRVWQNLRECDRSWGKIEKAAKVRQKLRKCDKSWESVTEVKKKLQKVQKWGKSWESMTKV